MIPATMRRCADEHRRGPAMQDSPAHRVKLGAPSSLATILLSRASASASAGVSSKRFSVPELASALPGLRVGLRRSRARRSLAHPSEHGGDHLS
jgi:hypothetical protein